jgi:hypothetical protein
MPFSNRIVKVEEESDTGYGPTNQHYNPDTGYGPADHRCDPELLASWAMTFSNKEKDAFVRKLQELGAEMGFLEA